MDDAAAPPEAMLFWRATAEGLDFFAAPAAAAHLCDPALAHYGWRDCTQPDPEDLIVLAGWADPRRLFMAGGLRVVGGLRSCGTGSYAVA